MIFRETEFGTTAETTGNCSMEFLLVSFFTFSSHIVHEMNP